MIIGIEAQHLLQPRKHGMDVVAAQIIRALAQLDTPHKFVIFARPGSDHSAVPAAAHLRVVEVAAPDYATWEQCALPLAVREAGCDLLHCTANTAPLASGVPLVLTLHDVIFLERSWLGRNGTPRQRLGTIYRTIVAPRVTRRARRVATVSTWERDQILRYLPELAGRLGVVSNAVAAHYFEARTADELARVRSQYALPTSFFLVFGNTDPKKNLEGVLRAYAMARRLCLPCPLLVIADLSETHLTEALHRIGESSLRSGIQLIGYVHQRDLPSLYRLASVFLYPSLRESFGLPILEAMACGTPVVTSSSSAMPEVAGAAALCVDPTRPAAIAEGMVTALCDQLVRARLRRDGPIRASSFSWQRAAEAWLTLYDSVGTEIGFTDEMPSFDEISVLRQA